MNDYTKLEKLLEKSGMDDYMMYTKEDLIDFGQLVVKECIEVVESQKAKMSYGPTFVIEDIEKHFGLNENTKRNYPTEA